MKRILAISLMVLFMTIFTEARTFVLSIGVSSYQNSEHNLSQTTKDAKAFHSMMKHHTKDASILTSKYANKENVLKKLRTICKEAGKGDRIIIFFSGHGFPGGIVAYDNVISYQEINNIFSTSAAALKLCFVDACHSGSVGSVQDNTREYKAPSTGNIIYMMSSRADEYSIEHSWVGHGYFSQALLKGLSGKADANKDKKITVRELFNYVYNDVQHTTAKMSNSQHPQLIGCKEAIDAVVVKWK